MNPAVRVVTQLPLIGLWQSDGFITEQRGSNLTAEAIVKLLRFSEVHFVVADVGKPLRWIAPVSGFTFWKQEGRTHLANPGADVPFSNFPGEYCYLASRWEGADLPIILLETYH